MQTHHNHGYATALRPWLIAVALLALAMVLVGCAVGPELVKPEVALNQQWSAAGSPLIETRAPPDSAWWTVFGDSTLNRLVERAFRQSLPLQLVGVRIMEARAQLAQAVGLQYPQIQAVTGGVSVVGMSQNLANEFGVDRIFMGYQLGVNVAWEADFWGRFCKQIKARSASLCATLADYDNALVLLTAEVARVYITIRTTEVLIDQAHRNAQLQEESLRLARSRYRNGVTSELDVIQAAALLANTRSSIPELESGLAQARNALCTLLGQPTGTAEALLQGSQGIPLAPVKIGVSVPAALLQRRPDVRAAALRAEAQSALIGIAKSELYPRIILLGLLSVQTGTTFTTSTASTLEPGAFIYTFGPRLLWPILNYGRIHNEVRVQDARLQQLLIDYENTVLRAAQEVEDALTGYLKSYESAVFIKDATDGARRAVELSLIQYREGAVDYERVLDAQRSLLQQQNSLARARSTIATNLIALHKALGGGWELRCGEPVVADSIQRQMQRRTDWGELFETPAQENSAASTPNDR